jgi:hypothetical protein
MKKEKKKEKEKHCRAILVVNAMAGVLVGIFT